MSSKNRFILGAIFIITSIAVGITAILGMKENSGAAIAFSCMAFMFMIMGIGQIVFSFILKDKVKKPDK